MTTLLVVGGATPSGRALRYTARERKAGRDLRVLTVRHEAAPAFERQECVVVDAGDWLSSGSLRLDDWRGAWDLCTLIDDELHLSGSWVVHGVDAWDACRVDFALHAASKWVKQINLAIALLDRFQPARLTVDDRRTVLNRALLAVAAARGVPALVLSGAVPTEGLAGLAHGIRLMAAAARSAWQPSSAHHRSVPSGAIVLLNHVRRNVETLQPIFERLQAQGRQALYATLGPDETCGVIEGAAERRRFDETPLGTRALWLALFARRLSLAVRRSWLHARGRVRYRGIDVGEVASLELPSAVAGMLFSAALWAERAAAFIGRPGPALLVTTNERATFGRAICSVARSRGIPVLLVQFGIVYPHPVIWSAPVMADVVAADGGASADVLRATGGCREVVVTGQPRHDALRAMAERIDKERARTQLGIRPRERVVLYASHAFGEEAADLARVAEADRGALEHELRSVYAEVSRLPGVTLVVKPHPNESMAMHRGILASLPDRSIVLLERSESITVPLIVCDLLITHHSTTGVDALVLGKPLVIVNLTGQPDAYPYVSEGAAVGAYRPEDVAAAVEQQLRPPALQPIQLGGREAFLCRHAAGADGRATERVVGIVARLLGFSPS